MITDEELAQLKEAAEKATLGPYFVAMDTAHDCPDHHNSGLALVDTGRSNDWPIARLCEWPTATFLSKCDPATILSLIERVEQAERDRDLAVAHDRQPYPTADAYEKVCAALEKHKATNVTLRDSALEDAAKVANVAKRRAMLNSAGKDDPDYDDGYAEAAQDIETEIRELKSTTVEDNQNSEVIHFSVK